MVGFCRFLRNDKVSIEKLIESAVRRCDTLSANREVLVLSDTSEFNFKDHNHFLSREDQDLGPGGNPDDVGFFLHPGLVIDAEEGVGLGFSYIKIWNRKYGQQKGGRHAQEAIEEKESYRWIECGLKSKENLSQASCITIIADRESDIYQEFALVPDNRTHLIIRSAQNRSLYGDQTRLYETLSEGPLIGQYDLIVRAKQKGKGKRQARQTTIEVRYKKIKIKRPSTLKATSAPPFIELYAIEAREKSELVPVTDTPICWRLLTTHAVESLSDACRIINWYSMRWQIELLFGTLKSKGLDIEASEVETGKGLKVLCLIGLQVALKINQLTQGRDCQIENSAQLIFSNEDIEVLKSLTIKYEGKTHKQKNNNTPRSIAWAAWTIARLGGWKGYTSEAKPGNQTMNRGLNLFEQILTGFKLARDLCA